MSKKLYIHETDCHGQGNVIYKGQVHYYCYDGESGDVKAAVKALIDIGFINPDDVVFIDGDEIYDYLKEEQEKCNGRIIDTKKW